MQKPFGFYVALKEWIQSFEKDMTSAHELGISIISLGGSQSFLLTEMSFAEPGLIVFQGFTAGGDPVELVQHFTQINVRLQAIPREITTVERKPIGFQVIHAKGETL